MATNDKTEQAAVNVVSPEALVAAMQAANAASSHAPAKKEGMDETIPGGKYWREGQWVDANRKPLDPQPDAPDEVKQK